MERYRKQALWWAQEMLRAAGGAGDPARNALVATLVANKLVDVVAHRDRQTVAFIRDLADRFELDANSSLRKLADCIEAGAHVEAQP